MTKTTNDIRPFRVEVPQADLDDLGERLARTRLPQPAPTDDWEYGVPNSYLAEMVEYWVTKFDWRAQEARMNAFPHYLTEIDGQTVHFVHVPSKEENATPLLLLHTYPGSFVDYLDMIDQLTDPVAHGGSADDAFSVVVPSIPGFGYSTPLVGRDWTMRRVAQTVDRLMRRLGYESYGVHGSDAGAMISRELGLLQPEGFLGLHVLQLFSFPSGDPAEFAKLEPKDYAALEHLKWFQSVGGYNQINATRPQTVAVAMADSPVGQLAWSELFNNFGNGTSLVSREQILTQVSLYWFTNTQATAGRYHFEEARAAREPEVNPSRTGVAVFADDFTTIRTFAERDNSAIVHWSEFPDGGHFAAMERPDVLVGDLRTYFRG
ncbi:MULTISPECIES: epoxide hydrolase family protein [unclassified Pseudofrankia]|uniref:epoxide hydrolase family protein n=1 Tax=unclassified Pseudofrankia TaxID=2994372 RepID=UPI0008D9EB08|nr:MULTISPECIES: epoxide hydrolase family protein [unclassified Pseudofrankia]MDT3446066.1 epoxide hydrolase [Pseudofrankia sp. BMG5.37]OHV55357.1 epoxide hydrolase [Pseudofrankia sp. BMG5.36]